MSDQVEAYVQACRDVADGLADNPNLSPPTEVRRMVAELQGLADDVPEGERDAFLKAVSDKLIAEAGPVEVIGKRNGTLPHVHSRSVRDDFLFLVGTAVAGMAPT